MDKAELVEQAKALGIKGAHLMKVETLEEKIAEASAPQPEPAPEPEPADTALCVVLAKNVWIAGIGPRSERRKVKGEKVWLPRAEAEFLASREQVVIV